MFHFIIFHLEETKNLEQFCSISAELKYQAIRRQNGPDFHLQTPKDVHQTAVVLW